MITTRALGSPRNGSPCTFNGMTLGVGRFVAGASCQGFAVEVLELGRQFADDSRLALRRQSRKAQALANERLPVTHR